MPRTIAASRGCGNLLQRCVSVSRRFGLSPTKIEAKLNRYVDVTEKLGCVPTFPVTAVLVKRHPEVIRRLCNRGVELAIHGYVHTDYKSVCLEEQLRHFNKAITIFDSYRIPFSGFRAPFLRVNSETIEALSKLKLAYDSSRSIVWDVLDNYDRSQKPWRDYTRLLDFYQPLEAGSYLSLPRFENGLVEIPVSIPDDEALVDRLNMHEAKEISRVWEKIFLRTYDRGELFTLQLHHERIGLCAGALEAVIRRARELDPPVWIASLKEIAQWWRERKGFAFEVHAMGSGRWRVKADCSERATVLVRNCLSNDPTTNWDGAYRSIDARDFSVSSPLSPFIGVGPNCSQDVVRFLGSEGFAVEVSDRPQDYGIYLDSLPDFRQSDEKPLCDLIDNSACPLIRYWRWPEKAKSALAITGDIDSITLIDFVIRVFEVRRQQIGQVVVGAKACS